MLHCTTCTLLHGMHSVICMRSVTRYALCYTVCTLLHGMHSVTRNALCHTVCTLSHGMHSVTRYALCYTVCTLSHGMHSVTRYAASRAPTRSPPFLSFSFLFYYLSSYHNLYSFFLFLNFNSSPEDNFFALFSSLKARVHASSALVSDSSLSFLSPPILRA